MEEWIQTFPDKVGRDKSILSKGHQEHQQNPMETNGKYSYIKAINILKACCLTWQTSVKESSLWPQFMCVHTQQAATAESMAEQGDRTGGCYTWLFHCLNGLQQYILAKYLLEIQVVFVAAWGRGRNSAARNHSCQFICIWFKTFIQLIQPMHSQY